MSTISQSSKDSTSESNKDISQYPSTLTLSADGLTKSEDSTQGDSNTTETERKDNLARVASFTIQQEPDVVASAKTSTSANNSLKRDANLEATSTPGPVAPPRRKKKGKIETEPSTVVSLPSFLISLLNSLNKFDFNF